MIFVKEFPDASRGINSSRIAVISRINFDIRISSTSLATKMPFNAYQNVAFVVYRKSFLNVVYETTSENLSEVRHIRFKFRMHLIYVNHKQNMSFT